MPILNIVKYKILSKLSLNIIHSTKFSPFFIFFNQQKIFSSFCLKQIWQRPIHNGTLENIHLINNEEDIVVFLRLKVLYLI